MPLATGKPRTQISRQLARKTPAKLLLMLCAFVCVVSATFARAQYNTGLTTVGNAGAPKDSQMSIDATQFLGGTVTNMCGAIAKACSQLTATVGASYPFGTTIDARGFSGDQVCKASDITQMLTTCVSSSTNPGSGKLLLGVVNLYADGPATNYTYASGDGVGTPAIVIPNNFWGIEGVSRGAEPGSGTNVPGHGTFLSICTGPSTPISGTHGCTQGFPQRTAPIQSISVSLTYPKVMTLNFSPSITAYAQELVMVKNAPSSADNGTFAIRTAGGASITVAAPPGAANCPTGPCGNVFLATPILGFGPTEGMNYLYTNGSGTPSYCMTTGSNPSPCSAFGEHIKNIGFNCQDYDGCVGWQNLYAQEESGADTFLVEEYNFVGADMHFNAQDFGPVLNAEIYTGNSNTHCDYGTVGVYMGDKVMRGLDGWTINVPQESQNPAPSVSECNGGVVPTAAVLLDAPNTGASHGHCEGFVNCVLIGANNDPAINTGSSVRDSAGNLYGTTAYGGTYGGGVVFKVDTTGAETVLYSFTGGADGANPYAGLLRDSAGNLYGTTTAGGAYGGGVVFKITPQ